MHHRVRQVVVIAVAVLAGAAATTVARPPERAPVILATTTSTQDSGLLDVLVPAFERETGYTVKTIAVGSGQAIEMGERGEADVVLVHAPAAEKEWVAAGKGRDRRIVMHNDFIIVGPADGSGRGEGRERGRGDARIADAASPSSRAATTRARTSFEQRCGRTPASSPRAAWYQESGQGMGATLSIANDKGAYTSPTAAPTSPPRARATSDPRRGRRRPAQRVPRDDIAPEAGERVNAAGGEAFADWLRLPAAQEHDQDVRRRQVRRAAVRAGRR